MEILTDLRNLQDNPQAWWDTDLVAKVVEEYVKRWGIEVIITFDDGGVSGHINHRAVGAGVRLNPFLVQMELMLDTSCYRLRRFQRTNLLRYSCCASIRYYWIFLSSLLLRFLGLCGR